MPHMHGFLAALRCKTDGARILKRTRFSSYLMSTREYHGQDLDKPFSIARDEEGGC